MLGLVDPMTEQCRLHERAEDGAIRMMIKLRSRISFGVTEVVTLWLEKQPECDVERQAFQVYCEYDSWLCWG